MLKYLIIQLANDSVSFCHYPKCDKASGLIPLETLREGIFYAMKENLNIQILYPVYLIPEDYKKLIDSADHTDIISSECADSELKNNAEIVVMSNWDSLGAIGPNFKRNIVIRTPKAELFGNTDMLANLLKKADRLVIVITDVERFTPQDFKTYEEVLNELIPVVKGEYQKGHAVQFNLLTDRMLLDKMNNCNAGDESITLAPDGNFYICPAFYLDSSKPVGSLKDDLEIKNPQLYRLDHAPICRICDAYQCRRCAWLNKKTTLEVNTPSHEQCAVAHIERNASKKLLESIRELGVFLPGKDIKELEYLDPFDKLVKN